MVGSCFCATNGSNAALSNELRSLLLRRGKNSEGRVDELQLMNLQALSGTSAFRRSRLLLAMLFFACCWHQVSSFPLAVGPLFSVAVSIMHRAVLDFDHCLLALRIIQPFITVTFFESAGFPQVLVVRAAAGCLTSSSVSVSLLETPCATFSWLSMSFSLANCSLSCSVLAHVLCVVCWTGQSSCTSLSCSGPLR